jgi:hypothetical protein
LLLLLLASCMYMSVVVVDVPPLLLLFNDHLFFFPLKFHFLKDIFCTRTILLLHRYLVTHTTMLSP